MRHSSFLSLTYAMLTSLTSWTFLERHDFYNMKETSSIQSVKSFYVCFIRTADETGNWIGNHPLSNSFRFQLRDDHFEKGTTKIFRIEILSNELSYLILTTFSIFITNGKTSSSYWTKTISRWKTFWPKMSWEMIKLFIVHEGVVNNNKKKQR